MKFNNSIISNFNSKRAINYLALLLVLFLSLNLNISCDTTEQQSKVKILLEAEDASCTEAWLNLKIESIALPIEITLFQGDSLLFTTNINSSDTTLFVENLLPNQNYSFYSSMSPFSHSVLKSNVASVTTMDTTSHNFTWETFEFGGANGSSYLNDVVIINENDIWAVGEIHTAETDQFDSNGVWVQPYNAVHWDGVNWELKRIMFYTFCNQEHKAPYPASAIFSFSDSSVAITSGSQITFVKDEKQKGIECIPVSVNSIWGTTSRDFYVVGNGGNIAHYKGSSWTKIESGTDVDLVDIWGSPNGEKIWVCGNDDFKPTVLLKIESDKVEILYSSRDNLFSYNYNQLSGDFTSIWTNNKNILYILTAYDLYKNYKGNTENPIPLWKNCNEQIATRKTRGTSNNNIFIAGENGLLSHFNGVSWKTYSELNILFREYKSISVTKNGVVAVGNDYTNGIEDKAIISITK